MIHIPQNRLFLAALVATFAFASSEGAHAYSTKLHLVTAHHVSELAKKGNCRITLTDWNNGSLKATAAYLGTQPGSATKTVTLNAEFCRLVTSPATRQYFQTGSVGPDTYPGPFGNTDPTHAYLWNTAWQIQVLWQNAKTDQEKAFVLGWLVHFAGDQNAHGLANLHAKGIWMQGGRVETVWRHIASETYYAKKMTPYPKGFNNVLVWPKAFIKRMFFNPNGVLYRHHDFLLSTKADDIGAVAKFFGAFYRMMFMLYDWHAREMHRWDGHRKYYLPKKGSSVENWLHWIFADQAFNFHKKKLAKIEKLQETWYQAAARAQQAIVSDKEAQWNGDKKYDKVYETLGLQRVKKDYYKSGGFGGLLDSYRFLAGGIADYASSSDLVSITESNSPELRKILDDLKAAGAAALAVVDGLKAVLTKLKDAILWPVKQIEKAIKAMLDPLVQEVKDLIFDEAICGRMPAMCRSIDAQTKAFGIKPGDIETYMRWPVYRNTITNAVVMLDRLQRMSRTSGNETQSPLFGLPSGDFGCTNSCVRVVSENARLYMPMAGEYYENASIKAVFPDYCMATGTDKRRNLPLNMNYTGKTNDQANQLDDAKFSKGVPGFTCFGSASKAGGRRSWLRRRTDQALCKSRFGRRFGRRHGQKRDKDDNKGEDKSKEGVKEEKETKKGRRARRGRRGLFNRLFNRRRSRRRRRGRFGFFNRGRFNRRGRLNRGRLNLQVLRNRRRQRGKVPAGNAGAPTATPGSTTTVVQPVLTPTPTGEVIRPTATPPPTTTVVKPILTPPPTTTVVRPILTPPPTTTVVKPLAKPSPTTRVAQPVATPRPVPTVVKPRMATVPNGPCAKDSYAPTGPKQFKGKIGEFLQKIYDHIVGRWDFRVHPAHNPNGATIVRSVGTQDTCYPALEYGRKTMAGAFPNVRTENAQYNKVAPYSLRSIVGNLFKPIGELVMQGVTAVGNWVKTKWKQAVTTVKTTATNVVNKVKTTATNVVDKVKTTASNVATTTKTTAKKVCSWVSEKVTSFFSGAKLLACKAKCKAKNLFSSSGYTSCTNSDCKSTTTQRKQVCK